MCGDSLACPQPGDAMSDVQTNPQNDEPGPIWQGHDGEPIPIGPKAWVIIRYRCGALSQPVEAGTHRWKSWPPEIGDTAFDIVGWRHADPT